MRRTELVSAIRDIERALKESSISEIFKGGPSDRIMSSESLPMVFALIKEYTKQTINFGEIHNVIIDTMGLKGLSDPDWWAKQILSAEKARSELFLMSQRVRFFYENFHQYSLFYNMITKKQNHNKTIYEPVLVF